MNPGMGGDDNATPAPAMPAAEPAAPAEGGDAAPAEMPAAAPEAPQEGETPAAM